MSLTLDASTKYVNQGTAALPSGDMTLGMWYKPTWATSDSAAHPFFSKNDTNPLDFFDIIKFTDNKFYAGWFDQSAATDQRVVSSASPTAASGSWHNLLVRRSGATTTLWIDGSQIATKDNGAFVANVGAAATRQIGVSTFSIGNSIGSDVAWFTIWDIALQSVQIAQLQTVIPTSVAATNLVDCLPLTAQYISGTTAINIGRSLVNGTIVGGPSVSTDPPLTSGGARTRNMRSRSWLVR